MHDFRDKKSDQHKNKGREDKDPYDDYDTDEAIEQWKTDKAKDKNAPDFNPAPAGRDFSELTWTQKAVWLFHLGNSAGAIKPDTGPLPFSKGAANFYADLPGQYARLKQKTGLASADEQQPAEKNIVADINNFHRNAAVTVPLKPGYFNELTSGLLQPDKAQPETGGGSFWPPGAQASLHRARDVIRKLRPVTSPPVPTTDADTTVLPEVVRNYASSFLNSTLSGLSLSGEEKDNRYRQHMADFEAAWFNDKAEEVKRASAVAQGHSVSGPETVVQWMREADQGVSGGKSADAIQQDKFYVDRLMGMVMNGDYGRQEKSGRLGTFNSLSINESDYLEGNVTLITQKIGNVLTSMGGGVFNLKKLIDEELQSIFIGAGVPNGKVNLDEKLKVLIPYSDIPSHYNVGKFSFEQRESQGLYEFGEYSVRDIYVGQHMRDAASAGFSTAQVRVGFPRDNVVYPESVRKGIMRNNIQRTIFNRIDSARSDHDLMSKLALIFKAKYHSALVDIYKDKSTPQHIKDDIVNYYDNNGKASKVSFDGKTLSHTLWIPSKRARLNEKKGIIIDVFDKKWFEIEINDKDFVVINKKNGADFARLLFSNIPRYYQDSFFNPMKTPNTGSNERKVKTLSIEITTERLKVIEVSDTGDTLRDITLDTLKKDADHLIMSPSEMLLDFHLKFLDSLGATLALVVYPPAAINPGGAGITAGNLIQKLMLRPGGGALLTIITSTIPNIFGLAFADREEDVRGFITDITFGLLFEFGANVIPDALGSVTKRVLNFPKKIHKSSNLLKKIKGEKPIPPNLSLRFKERRLKFNKMDGTHSSLKPKKHVSFILPSSIPPGLEAPPGTLSDIVYNYARIPSLNYISNWTKSNFVGFDDFSDYMNDEKIEWLPFYLPGINCSQGRFHLTDFTTPDAQPVQFPPEKADEAIRHSLMNKAWDPDIEKSTKTNSSSLQKKLNILSQKNNQTTFGIMGVSSKKDKTALSNGTYSLSDIHFVLTTKNGTSLVKNKLDTMGNNDILIKDILPENNSEFLPDVEMDSDTDVMKNIVISMLNDRLTYDIPSQEKITRSLTAGGTNGRSLLYFGTDFRGLKTNNNNKDIIEIDNFSLLDADVNARNQQKLHLIDNNKPGDIAMQINKSMGWISYIQEFNQTSANQNSQLVNNLNKLVDIYRKADVGYLSQKKLVPELWDNADRLNIPVIVAVDDEIVKNNKASHQIHRKNIAFVVVEGKYVNDVKRYLNRKGNELKINVHAFINSTENYKVSRNESQINRLPLGGVYRTSGNESLNDITQEFCMKNNRPFHITKIRFEYLNPDIIFDETLPSNRLIHLPE
ncbi:hypothetical protein OQ483_23770 (plasmid) [Enterobacter bugandensis]|uniref:hypothetical protein n=1 Tax=Enterobacter bugandensis TaxID=881260 RepID=UPI00283A9226|nr:hypothetical protein [Enterobacter bugandensis]WMU75415.1 hypothetical protein OQ483_23770 [Enterobacter bugandensis]